VPVGKGGVEFATDDEYNNVYDKTPNQLRALGIEVPKEEKKQDEEEKKEEDDEEGEQIGETQGEEETKEEMAAKEKIYKMKQAVQNK
jgi:hypothetical protein